MPGGEAKYFNVTLVWRVTTKKASPFVSVKVECLVAQSKDDAKSRALTLFALAGNLVQVVEVMEL